MNGVSQLESKKKQGERVDIERIVRIGARTNINTTPLKSGCKEIRWQKKTPALIAGDVEQSIKNADQVPSR